MTLSHDYRKRNHVVYSTGSSDVRANVVTVHKDGSLTVKAHFYIDKEGNDIPGYLGFKYRLWPNDPQVNLRHASREIGTGKTHIISAPVGRMVYKPVLDTRTRSTHDYPSITIAPKGRMVFDPVTKITSMQHSQELVDQSRMLDAQVRPGHVNYNDGITIPDAIETGALLEYQVHLAIPKEGWAAFAPMFEAAIEAMRQDYISNERAISLIYAAARNAVDCKEYGAATILQKMACEAHFQSRFRRGIVDMERSEWRRNINSQYGKMGRKP